MTVTPQDYNQNLHHQEDRKCHVKYRVFYFAAWPISAGPTLRLTLCQCCVIHCISGRFNSQWRELDKRSFIIWTTKKRNTVYLFRFYDSLLVTYRPYFTKYDTFICSYPFVRLL
jgi:hypothetical protein